MRLLPLLLLGCPTVEFTMREHTCACELDHPAADDRLPSGASVRATLDDLTSRLHLRTFTDELVLALDVDTATTEVYQLEGPLPYCTSWGTTSLPGTLTTAAGTVSVDVMLELFSEDDALRTLWIDGFDGSDEVLASIAGLPPTTQIRNLRIEVPRPELYASPPWPVSADLTLGTDAGRQRVPLIIDLEPRAP